MSGKLYRVEVPGDAVLARVKALLPQKMVQMVNYSRKTLLIVDPDEETLRQLKSMGCQVAPEAA